jgi:hypothetical protein
VLIIAKLFFALQIRQVTTTLNRLKINSPPLHELGFNSGFDVSCSCMYRWINRQANMAPAGMAAHVPNSSFVGCILRRAFPVVPDGELLYITSFFRPSGLLNRAFLL